MIKILFHKRVSIFAVVAVQRDLDCPPGIYSQKLTPFF